MEIEALSAEESTLCRIEETLLQKINECNQQIQQDLHNSPNLYIERSFDLEVPSIQISSNNIFGIDEHSFIKKIGISCNLKASIVQKVYVDLDNKIYLKYDFIFLK